MVVGDQTNVIAMGNTKGWWRHSGTWTRMALPIGAHACHEQSITWQVLAWSQRRLFSGGTAELVTIDVRVPWVDCDDSELVCDDEVDNDCDGLIDADDPTCSP